MVCCIFLRVQVLQIATKIVKGQIEITSDVHLVTKGEKVCDNIEML